MFIQSDGSTALNKDHLRQIGLILNVSLPIGCVTVSCVSSERNDLRGIRLVDRELLKKRRGFRSVEVVAPADFGLILQFKNCFLCEACRVWSLRLTVSY